MDGWKGHRAKGQVGRQLRSSVVVFLRVREYDNGPLTRPMAFLGRGGGRDDIRVVGVL